MAVPPGPTAEVLDGDPEVSPLLDRRFSPEFRRRLRRYMGDPDPGSGLADRYLDWYRDHAGRRSEWLRSQLLWRLEGRRPLEGRRVLDFGCGTGSSSVVFAERGAQVLGVETDAISIDVARQRAVDLGVAARCSFVQIPYLRPGGVRLPIRDGSFDVCTLIGVLEHMLPPERAFCLAEIRRVLVPGGELFVYDTPNRAYPFDHHTTRLWFASWLPLGLARRYALLRHRFDRERSFERAGGTGVSRRALDRLFRTSEWCVCHDKSLEEVALELGWLCECLPWLRPRWRARAQVGAARASATALRLLRFAGFRPVYWTSSHAVGWTKRDGP